MFVGVARMTLSIPGARSLKDKRSVVRSFRDRVRSRLSASIAEVGDLDRLQVATLGACVVAREATRCHELLSEVTALAGGLRGALLADVATEVIAFGAGGRGVRGGIEQALSRVPGEAPDSEEEE